MCTEECGAVNGLKQDVQSLAGTPTAIVLQQTIDLLRCEEDPLEKYCCDEEDVIETSTTTTTTTATTTTTTTTTTLGKYIRGEVLIRSSILP